MISKKDLVKRIREDIKTEEVAVVLYSKHLKDTLRISGIDEAVREKMVDLLDKLTEESRQHERVMKELLEKILGSDRDVY